MIIRLEYLIFVGCISVIILVFLGILTFNFNKPSQNLSIQTLDDKVVDNTRVNELLAENECLKKELQKEPMINEKIINVVDNVLVDKLTVENVDLKVGLTAKENIINQLNNELVIERSKEPLVIVNEVRVVDNTLVDVLKAEIVDLKENFRLLIETTDKIKLADDVRISSLINDTVILEIRIADLVRVTTDDKALDFSEIESLKLQIKELKETALDMLAKAAELKIESDLRVAGLLDVIKDLKERLPENIFVVDNAKVNDLSTKILILETQIQNMVPSGEKTRLEGVISRLENELSIERNKIPLTTEKIVYQQRTLNSAEKSRYASKIIQLLDENTGRFGVKRDLFITAINRFVNDNF